MNPGTVFQVSGRDNHPRIILSRPYNGRVLTCNLTDASKCPESPCFCNVADHEWITKESGIPFRYLTTLPYAGFEPAKQAGHIRVSEIPFPVAKLRVICEAILVSTSVSEMFKQYLRQ
jgi:hypothetical protein